MLGVSLACGIAAQVLRVVHNRSFRIGLLLLVVAVATATGDYLVIYRPLSQMIAGSNLPAEFASYHRWSMWINALELIVCAAAAICLQWPESET